MHFQTIKYFTEIKNKLFNSSKPFENHLNISQRAKQYLKLIIFSYDIERAIQTTQFAQLNTNINFNSCNKQTKETKIDNKKKPWWIYF